MEWQHYIAGIIREEEKNFLNKHLITQNIANGSAKIQNPHPAVSVFNFHYASPPTAVAVNYHLNKPIGDNETGFRGNSDSVYRMEGWRFILAGGALYNNLDYSFATGYENGTFPYPATQPGGGTTTLRKQLQYLKQFIDRFQFIRMSPDSTFIAGGLSTNAVAQVLSEGGKQYAVYIYGNTREPLELNLPTGKYEAEWMHPVSGRYEKKKKLVSKNGKTSILLPAYEEDIALRIVRRNI